MKIQLQKIAHSYKGEMVFSPIDYTFLDGSKTVIKGGNGSGKSTLLRIISSFITPTEGGITYSLPDKIIDERDAWKHVAICSPALQLEENFNLNEAFDFHFSLRKIINATSKDDFFNSCFLKEHSNKKVASLSSGMRQRFKLAIAFHSQSDFLLLDEPCMNLDVKGIEMYSNFCQNLDPKRTHIVASNSVENEYRHCNAEIVLKS